MSSDANVNDAPTQDDEIAATSPVAPLGEEVPSSPVKAPTPHLPPHRSNRGLTVVINSTDAIAAAVQAQRRQGMGETVSNALEVAQILVQYQDDERYEDGLRAQLQRLLYGAGGGPNIILDRKARTVADFLDDSQPNATGGSRHPLEALFARNAHTDSILPEPMPHPIPGHAAGAANLQKDRKGRSRGLTQYQPYRRDKDAKSPSPSPRASTGIVQVESADSAERDASEQTSRAPSELHFLGNRLKTYRTKKMRFPVVEKSKELIHQLRQFDSIQLTGSSIHDNEKKKPRDASPFSSPPPHRCRHTQRPKKPDDGSPKGGAFAQLELPATAPDDYRNISEYRAPSAGQQTYVIHRHEYYVPTHQRKSAEATDLISWEHQARLGAHAEAKALASMVADMGCNNGQGGNQGRSLQLCTAITPQLEDYLPQNHGDVVMMKGKPSQSRSISRRPSRSPSLAPSGVGPLATQSTPLPTAEYVSPAQRIRAQYAHVLTKGSLGVTKAA